MHFIKNLTFILTLTICNLSFATSFMGINTNELTHFDASVPFVDLFKSSKPFFETLKYTKGMIKYDKNGWASNLNGGQAGTYFLQWMPYKALPKGDYTVRYKGEGTIDYKEDVELVSRSKGRDIIRFHKNKFDEVNAALVIQASNPNNYIRNISITPPGGICQNNPFKTAHNNKNCMNSRYLPFEYYHKNITFNPAYLAFMRPFKTIRFMNMSGITRNAIVNWSKRPHLNQATWGGKEGRRGAPLEVMVKLSNILHANAWFNIPHQANDEYILEHAKFINKNLRGHLKAYVEYTNEAWNSVFSQTHYVRKKGVALGLDPSLYWAGIKYYSKRSKEVFRIWKNIFSKNPSRLITVLSGWSENTQITEVLLSSSKVYELTDVFAVAPYFYTEQSELVNSRSTQDIFSLLNDPNKKRSIPTILSHMEKHADTTKKYGVGLVAYEGGQHLVYNTRLSKKIHPNPLIKRTNLNPKMEDAYIRLIEGFKDLGGSLFMSFSSPRVCSGHSGCMGVLEHIQQKPMTSPKYRALKKYF